MTDGILPSVTMRRPPGWGRFSLRLFGFQAMPIRVDSEVGRLRRGLVHRPGREIDWMVPSMMEQLLFDDILDGDDAREEHDLFCAVLRHAGAEVLEAQGLLEEALQDAATRDGLLGELGR